MSVLAALTHLDDATDGQLLGRFVQSRDAEAFAALVHRLGPTVLAVCRRVCPDAHFAEDAFQAAFLVLAKKADRVRPREQVAVWLHGVAYRTASKARAMLANHRRRETGPVDLPDPSTQGSVAPDDELRKLDAAIAALPDHLRAAVVLCELEGRSRKDAAQQLGIPEGTLSSRLAEARKRLGRQLRPTVAVVTAALAANTAEAVVSGSTSEIVRSLAHGVMSMMLLHKLKLPAAVVVAVMFAGLAVAVTPHQPPAEEKAKTEPPKAEAKNELKWRLNKGDVFYLTVEEVTDIKTHTRPGVKINPESTQQRGTAVWKVTVTAAGKDGLGGEMESVSFTAGKGENGKTFETAEVAGMVGSKFTTTFDTDRKVKTVADAKDLNKASATARATGLSVAPAEVVANTLEQMLRLLPAVPAKDGEWEWTVESTHPVTQIVSTWARRAKLDSTKDGLATVTTVTGYERKSGPQAKPPLDKVFTSGSKCGGTFTFDTRTGRLVKFEETLTLGGPPPKVPPPDADIIGSTQVFHSIYTVTAKPPKRD